MLFFKIKLIVGYFEPHPSFRQFHSSGSKSNGRKLGWGLKYPGFKFNMSFILKNNILYIQYN